MARFVIAPQWQGSASSRAMQLVEGAEAIAGDLPRSACTRVDVPSEAGENLGTPVRRLSTLLRVRDTIEDAVRAAGEPVIVIGGDCGVALGAIAPVAADDIAVVWFDAHPDLHAPDSSPSGAFTGMVLRAILGEGVDGLALAPGAVSPDRIILIGTRDPDPAEEEFIAAHGIRVLQSDDLSDADALADAVAQTGASRVYVHIDVDVLDPSAIEGLANPVPFGAQPADVVASVRALRARFPLAGATLSGFAPHSANDAVADLGTILRLVGALA